MFAEVAGLGGIADPVEFGFAALPELVHARPKGTSDLDHSRNQETISNLQEHFSYRLLIVNVSTSEGRQRKYPHGFLRSVVNNYHPKYFIIWTATRWCGYDD